MIISILLIWRGDELLLSCLEVSVQLYIRALEKSRHRWAKHQKSTHAVLYFNPKVTADALGF